MDFRAAIEAADVDTALRQLEADPSLANAPILQDGGTPPTTPLIHAARLGVTEVALALIDAGARIDERGQFGETALHWAASTGNETLVKRLLERGAPSDATDTRAHSTPVDWAHERMAREELPGHAAVIARLGRTGRGWILSYMGRSALLAGVLGGGFVMSYASIKPGGGLAWVVELLTVFVLFVGMLAAVTALPFLLNSKWRRHALAVFACSTTAFIVAGMGMGVGLVWRDSNFETVGARAESVVEAIVAHVRDNGQPPKTVQELVPRYLQKIPDGLPEIAIVTGEKARLLSGNNDWFLEVNAATSAGNHDKFAFFPNQQYPKDNQRGLSVKVLGKWAYFNGGY